MVNAYREAIRCERLREAVFAGETRPGWLGNAPGWAQMLADAMILTAQERHAEAREQRTQELEAEVKQLNKENAYLSSELLAGKAMIQQFSKLMKDKADMVCQYCRRSGTLASAEFSSRTLR